MTADSPAEATEPALLASLDYAEIQIRSSARLFIHEPDDDPGLLRVDATIRIPDFPDDGPPLAAIDGIGLFTTALDDRTTAITILRTEGLVLDLNRIENTWETLDAHSEELLRYACLLDPQDGNKLHPDLEERLSFPVSGRVLIIERLRVAPAWRGFGGVGRYLVSRLLPWMCADAAVVATQPFPIDTPRDERGNVDKAVFGPALKQIRRTWKSIGFEPYRDDIWIMDPFAAKHERAVAKLERKLGLSPISR